MAALFAITLFASALLLFWVQPMLAKMVLPLLGGTPAVWNICMVFFQAVLLAGYAYAHWVATRLSLRMQVLLHSGLLVVTILALPIGVSPWALERMPEQSNFALWLLLCLFLSAGLPFFAVSTNGPLLQRWFSRSRHSAAHDPYFLYAASNLGSLLALLGYPLLIEPALRLGHQSRWWSAGFMGLVLLVAGCGTLLLYTRRLLASGATGGELEEFDPGLRLASAPITPWQRVQWCLWAFVPSSLMLGVTTYLTTDIASIPLLWVVPLATYLLTFVLVFARRGERSWRWTPRALPIGALALAYMLLSEGTEPVWAIVLLHLAVFFLAAMVCHGQLAASRPSAAHLTEFYLWIAVGGVLGGLFNGLAAPLLFTRVAEYPLALILACWMAPAVSRRISSVDVIVALGMGLLVAVLAAFVLPVQGLPLQLRLGIAFGAPLMACYAAVDRPARFALCLGGVMLTSSFFPGIHGDPLLTERNFFGVLRVTQDPAGPFLRLVHGSTIHGRQSTDPASLCDPLSYYHRSGPLGQVIDVYRAGKRRGSVAVIGLGAGSMAAYSAPGETWTFYEVNPGVVRIATDTNYFTFTSACAEGRIELVLGDARLRLDKAGEGQFGLLVLDAFSSDAIPLHLITREALQLYLSKLAPGGLLAFHISNRSMDLEDVLGDLAADAQLVCHARDEMDVSPGEAAEGKDASHWVVMGRQKEDLGKLVRDSRWLPVKGRQGVRVWSDDFSNIISVLHWR
ncbi:MAG: spermidine synthase [Verrucomicrobiia bacterium]